MEKIALAFSVLLAATTVFTGCSSDDSNDDSSSTQVGTLMNVEFQDLPEKVITRTATGNVVGNQKEYLEEVQKAEKVSDLGIFKNINQEEIYPGSVLDGDLFMADEYVTLHVDNVQPITLSSTLRGTNYAVSRTIVPTLSNVRQSINDMLYGKDGVPAPDTKNAPSFLNYEATDVTTAESFNKSFHLHIDVGGLGKLVKANFDYDRSRYHSNTKHHFLVQIKQQFYSVSVNPLKADDWGRFVGISNGKYAPVYVSNVDYGRVVYMLIDTNMDKDSVTNTVSAGVTLGFGKVSAGANTTASKTLTKMFNNKQIQVVVLGGSPNNVSKISSFDDLINYLKVPEPGDLVNSAVPIGYSVRSVKSGKKINVRTYYTEERLVLGKKQGSPGK